MSFNKKNLRPDTLVISGDDSCFWVYLFPIMAPQKEREARKARIKLTSILSYVSIATASRQQHASPSSTTRSTAPLARSGAGARSASPRVPFCCRRAVI